MKSVCIATFNGEKYIKQQLLSILSQLNANDEIVISDDGSSDQTVKIVRELNDSKIKLIDGPHSGSPIDNFENALKVAKGDFIFLSDQDDQWRKGKVEICMEYLKEFDCVISDCYVTDKNMHVISDSFYRMNRTQGNILYNLFIKNGYLGCCMAFKRKVLNASLPFPNHIPMHDIWIGNVCAFNFKLIFIPDKLIYFRRHGDNASPTASKSTYTMIEKIRFRNNIIKNILLLKFK